jgi:hypothetical protein
MLITDSCSLHIKKKQKYVMPALFCFQQVKIYLMFIARDVGTLIISILTESRKSVNVKPTMMPLP